MGYLQATCVSPCFPYTLNTLLSPGDHPPFQYLEGLKGPQLAVCLQVLWGGVEECFLLHCLRSNFHMLLKSGICRDHTTYVLVHIGPTCEDAVLPITTLGQGSLYLLQAFFPFAAMGPFIDKIISLVVLDITWVTSPLGGPWVMCALPTANF